MKKTSMPIIIGGVHRSGTSLVRRVLNTHSNIYCGPEVKFFKEWYGDYIGVNDPIKHARFMQSARALLPEAELFQILGASLIKIHKRAAELAGKSRWADKNPENVLYLDLWENLLGNAWLFIHVVRNPLDTLASMVEINFKYAIPANLDSKIAFYKEYTETGLNYYLKNPAKSYRLVYEKFVSSPEDEVQKLMHWLGEKAERAQLDFNSLTHQNGLEDPKVKHTKDIHAKSINRWKNTFSSLEARKIVRETNLLWKKLNQENIYPLEKALNSLSESA